MVDLHTLSNAETGQLILVNPADWVNAYMEARGMGIRDIAEEGSYSTAVNSFNIKQVDSEGGYEGGGEYACVVLGIYDEHRPDDMIAYFQINGCYYSYNGTEWEDSFTVVEPYQELVTKYKAV